MEAFVYLLLAAVAAYVVGLLVKLSSQKEIEEMQHVLVGVQHQRDILRTQLAQARWEGGVSEHLLKITRDVERRLGEDLAIADDQIKEDAREIRALNNLIAKRDAKIAWLLTVKDDAFATISRLQAERNDLLSTLIDRDCEISDLNDKLFYETMWKEYCQERLNYYHAFSVLVAVRPQAALPAPTDELLLA